MAIKRSCYNCSGDGTVTTYDGEQVPSEVECPVCAGTGTLEFGEVEELAGMYQTYKVVEATDNTEYGDLSDNNKDAYQMIISCGFIDLSNGTAIRTKLWNMFDENSTTRANLLTLIGE